MRDLGYIIEILEKTENFLKQKDYIKIKDLSNKLIHHSSINQDIEIVYITVIIYALSKLIERGKYASYKNWQKFYEEYSKSISILISKLKEKDFQGFSDEIIKIRGLIENLSGNLKYYVSEVFRKSKINKASRIYEHGISMEKTAKILGISLWELSEYVGGTKIADVDLSITLPINKRIKYVEEIFQK